MDLRFVGEALFNCCIHSLLRAFWGKPDIDKGKQTIKLIKYNINNQLIRIKITVLKKLLHAYPVLMLFALPIEEVHYVWEKHLW